MPIWHGAWGVSRNGLRYRSNMQTMPFGRRSFLGKGDKGSLIARQLDYWTEALCDLPEQLERHRLSEAGCCQLSGRKRVVSDFA